MKTKIISMFAFAALILTSCGGGEEQKGEEQAKQETGAVSGKYTIKDSDNKYVVMNADSTLSAIEADSSKALVFEIIDAGNGKVNIKTAAGKFVCTEMNLEMKLFANRNSAGSWESFEVVRLQEPNKVNIKSVDGQFVSSDRNKGSLLFGDRIAAGNWETFTLTKK